MYSELIPDYADIMTIEEFKEEVKGGMFIDYDGFGHPVKDGMEDEKIYIYPSKIHEIPEDATHIAWYNK